MSTRIYGDANRSVRIATAAKIGRVDQESAGVVEFRNECVGAADLVGSAIGSLKRAKRRREVP